MDVVVIREWLMPSNPERGVQEEVFLLPNEELFSSYVEKLTGVKDAVATGERYVTYEDDEAIRGYAAAFPPAIQQHDVLRFRSQHVLIRDLKQALTEVLDVVDEVHDNGENCPYCGAEYGVGYCPNKDDCQGDKARAVIRRANAHLNA